MPSTTSPTDIIKMARAQRGERAMESLVFPVRRREAVLVGPASPTPRETKRLSDIDSNKSLRVLMPGIFIYRGGGSGGSDPVDIIRRALSVALVHFYPLAGRLREVECGRKLVVDCTGEGVLFAEADADVRLSELEAAGGGSRWLTPPFPCMEELLLDVDRSRGMLTWPLVVIQVTRLLCGGFVFAMRISHAMCDAAGVFLFMSAVADLARGLPAPEVAPAWSRELFDAPTPLPPLADEHSAVPLRPPPHGGDVKNVMTTRFFVFGAADVELLKKRLPPHLRGVATTFEVLAALLWRSRTAALALPPGEVVWLGIIASFRRSPALRLLPRGYYGNVCIPLRASAPAGVLLGSSDLGDAVEKVREAKVTAGRVRSAADMSTLHGPSLFASPNMFLLSDLRHTGFHSVDFGWGAPVYGGPSQVRHEATFFVAVKDADGEAAVAMPITLPRTVMERFAAEIQSSLESAA